MKIKVIAALLVMFITPLSMAHVKITYGVSTHKNKRAYQEDRFDHAIINGGDFFGVYDGHGGYQVSSLLKSNLPTYFKKAEGSIENKFDRAFEQADYISQNSWPNEGSTALAVYIGKDDVLHWAWCGDTRAVLECNDKVCVFTKDHKPHSPAEKQRIEQAGGGVYHYGVWRVNGLAVSRSIGDKSCKLAGIGQIIATPEYESIHLKSDNHFLILASDGLWDVMSNETAVAIVVKELRNKKPLDVIAEILQNAAIKKGSGDNITVCVVQFDWQQDFFLKRWWDWLRGK